MDDLFPVGKLPATLLTELLSQVTDADPRVIVGPGIGVDAAVLDMGDRYLVAKTDPITFATDRVGWYAVHVNANDVACMGGSPQWFLATLLMPEGQAREIMARTVFDQIAKACESLGVGLVGGHTETTYGIDRPIVMGCMLGEVEPDQLITPAGIEVGDALILAGGIPIEATAIIALEKAEELKDVFEPDFLTRCASFLDRPGISVVGAAKASVEAGNVHAMHDPTEGGLATGLWELAMASETAIRIDKASIEVLPEGRILCDHYGIDPLASIASGALLIATSPETAEGVIARIEAGGTSAARIGEVEASGEASVIVSSAGTDLPLPFPERDEIATLFESQG